METHTQVDNRKSWDDYIAIVKRRKLSLVLPAVTVFMLVTMVAVVLPTTFQSSATILIEEQPVSPDYVPATLDRDAARQVQVVSHKVLTAEKIVGIVEKFGVYEVVDAAGAKRRAEVVNLFRRNVDLDLVRADTIDPRSGRRTKTTIAFTLAFKSPSASTAQQVTEELVRLFLNENLREHSYQAVQNAESLSVEASRLNEELLVQERALAEFELAQEGSLRELHSFNLSTLERSYRERSAMTLRTQSLQKNRLELIARMAKLKPTPPAVPASGGVVLNDADRLKTLQAEYRRKAAIYGSNHPAVKRLDRELRAFKAELRIGLDVVDLQDQLKEQTAILADLRTRFNDNYNEVKNVHRVIAQLEQSIRLARAQPQPPATSPGADNPAYVMLQTQLNDIESELRKLRAKKTEIDQRIAQHESLVKRAPVLERDYQALVRGYDIARSKYQEVRVRQREAMLAKNIGDERKGDRFALSEPPDLPSTPISPNRPALVFLGAVLGVCAGLGFALIRETLDKSIHGIRELTAIMGVAPLVGIAYIENDEDHRVQQSTFTLGVLAATACLLVFLHLFFRPLNLLLLDLLGQLGIT